MKHALFDIAAGSTQERLIIRDLGHSIGRPSVTNDAEAVVATLHHKGLLAGRRLFYYDSEGTLDELLHDGAGHFLGFAPGGPL